MAIKNSVLEYTRNLKDDDELYIDAAKANEYINEISTTMTALAKDYNNIKTAYKRLHDDVDTKGDYKEIIGEAYRGASKRAAYCEERKTELKNRLLQDTQTYVNTLLGKEFMDLEESVEDLGRNVEI